MRTAWDLSGCGVRSASVAVVVVVVACAACSTAKLARRAHRARVDLAGLSRVDLEECAGQPVRLQHAGDWEYLTYLSPTPTTREDASRCVATFMVRNGYVEGLDYETTTGDLIGKNITECLAIVDPCLAKKKTEGS